MAFLGGYKNILHELHVWPCCTCLRLVQYYSLCNILLYPPQSHPILYNYPVSCYHFLTVLTNLSEHQYLFLYDTVRADGPRDSKHSIDRSSEIQYTIAKLWDWTHQTRKRSGNMLKYQTCILSLGDIDLFYSRYTYRRQYIAIFDIIAIN